MNPRVDITIGAHRLDAEVVADPMRRWLGLMFRTSMAPDAGMLFVFPDDTVLSFWMSNTPLPLSVAFLDAKRRILNIADMDPYDEEHLHDSDGPARYALEVHRGWFEAHGIGPGDDCELTLPTDLVVA